MELLIKSLEQVTSPIEIVNLLGKSLLKESNGHYTTSCPKCESKLFIVDKEFVCENNSCIFRAGSVIDYIVASEGCKWADVLDVLNTMLNKRLDGSVILKNKKALCLVLKNKRRLFDFFLRIGLQGCTNNMTTLQYKTAIRGQGIDPDMLRWSVFICGNQDSQILHNLVKELNPNNEKEQRISHTNIVLPYFANHHTISHLVILKSPAAKPEKIDVLPHRISYFGLLQRHPKCEQTNLAYTYADAAKLNTQYGRVSPEKICLHMLLDAKAEGTSLTLPSAEYVITSADNENLRAVALLQKYVPSLTIDNNKVNIFKDGKKISVNDYVINCLMMEVKRGGDIKAILDLVDLPAPARQELLSRLHAERFFEEGDIVRNYFKTLPIYTDDKVTLYSGPNGYTLTKHANEAYSTFVTNFTIELEQNVVFTESTDVFHAGNVIFNNNHYPVVIKQEDLERAGELEKAVRNATLSSSMDENTMPTIKERGAARYLTSYLREQLSVLPRVEGIPMLGWSHKRTSFYAPYFISDKKGSRSGKKYFHPNIVSLSHYTTDIDIIGQLYHDLPTEIINIINQSAAFIARSFLSMPVRPIALYNRTEARTLLAAMFSGVGQIAIAQLNNNIRGEEMPGVRGFPYYAVGYSAAQVNKSVLPAFILCDNGAVIDNIYDPEILDKAKKSLKFIVQKVAEWAITTEAANFKQANSVSRFSAYSTEGANVVIDACGLMTWPSSITPYEHIDKMLSGIRFDEVKQYFIRDINKRIMRIKKEAADDIDISGLTEELQGMSQLVLVTDTSINVDSEVMMEALSVYYHNAPMVTEIFDTQELMQKVVMPTLPVPV